MTQVMTAAEAARLIQPGDTVACAGVIGWLTPDAVLQAIAERYESQGTPSALTLYCPVAVGDALNIRGMDRLGLPGLLRRIISGSYVNPLNPQTGERPAIMSLIQKDLIEAYSWPIGASMHWLREVARRSTGYLTEVGIDTYIDPRHTGGKLNTVTTEDLVHVVDFAGREQLFYPAFPLDVGIIRASTADRHGNLSFEGEPFSSSSLHVALAVKASGGSVIAQVGSQISDRPAAAGVYTIPSNVVDAVVVEPDQMMGTDVAFDASYLGSHHRPLVGFPRLEDGAGKIVSRRIARMIEPRRMTIFGFGMSSDVPMAMIEDGLLTDENLREFEFTTEHGSFGGVVMSGWQFSANVNPTSVIDGPSQFDYINGGGCDVAVLSFAEYDAQGSVNVSRFGASNPGAGGFIDIAHSARLLIFAGTFTTGGLSVAIRDGRLSITQEGRIQKFVPQVTEVTYRVSRGVRERGQEALIVTERAIFSVEEEGLNLIEVAPGIDPREVADRMAVPCRVSEAVALMPSELFLS